MILRKTKERIQIFRASLYQKIAGLFYIADDDK